MKKKEFVAVPVDLVNEILGYLSDHKYKDVCVFISRLSTECLSIREAYERLLEVPSLELDKTQESSD